MFNDRIPGDSINILTDSGWYLDVHHPVPDAKSKVKERELKPTHSRALNEMSEIMSSSIIENGIKEFIALKSHQED